MVHRYYQLPSLTSLTAFEASARHRSIKLAAGELNVTPSAISRQIKSLEEELGTPLFVRGSSGVSLTADGEELYSVVSNGFSRAAEAVLRIKRGNRSRHVTLACTNAVASMWLIPRMCDFWRRYPEITVDHLISDDARDFRRAEVDLCIRYGSGAWPDEMSRILMSEKIYPICSSRFAETHAGSTIADLPFLPLLHVYWVDPDWTDWSDLLRLNSVPHGPLPGRRFSRYDVTVQACQDDQGLALGWDRLVGDLVSAGKLVRFTDLETKAPGSHFLTWNRNREPTPAVDVFKTWLIETCAKEP